MQKDFEYYLNQIGEIGYVEKIDRSIAYASGLPEVKVGEIVLFETGEVGQVMTLGKDEVEVLLLTTIQVKVGEKIARTDELLEVSVGDEVLGKTVDPLGRKIGSETFIDSESKKRIDIESPGIANRVPVTEPLETGVTLVDLVVPVSKGQRELVIGDRGTGKSRILMQMVLNQSRKGVVCIYAVIGRKASDIRSAEEFLAKNNIKENTVVVASRSSDPSGLIFQTPYTAMTYAEYFKDKGMDVLVVLDDLTTHAKYYREISLLARRFPGRSSYPGDIFYTHARLLERAGNFKKGSITCLPAAESIMGDLSGYIQTNLMAMTDGHIFLDIELFDQGRRPAVNPFLSVTRVGHQTQTPLQRDVSRTLSSFLIYYEKMKQFMHFGAEVGENVKKVLNLGGSLLVFFNQSPDVIIPININIMLLAGIWIDIWKGVEHEVMKNQMADLISLYETNSDYKKQVDDFIKQFSDFSKLIETLRQDDSILRSNINVSKG